MSSFLPPFRYSMVVATALAMACGASADDKAQDVLKAFAARFSESPGVSVKANVSYELVVQGQQESLSTLYDLSFERPGRLSLRVHNDDVDVLFKSDGESLVTYIPEFAQFTAAAVPATFDEVMARSGFGPIRGVAQFMAEFVKPAAFGDLVDGAEWKGEEDGESHVRVSRDDQAWDVWFRGTDAPVLTRVEVDTAPLIEDLKSGGVDAKLSVFATFDDWAFEDVDDGLFAFAAPAGAEEVTEFAPPQPKNGPFALLGKPAPAFSLDVMGGGSLDLASKPADAIYVLDFWATWCGPCRQAMPIIDKVSKEFAEQGVKLFAVNLQESPEEIKAFLDSQSLDVTVALDTEGDVAQKYLAGSIPQTVIVAKDGTVQVVHVGIGPTLETQLREELTALVKGESLVD